MSCDLSRRLDCNERTLATKGDNNYNLWRSIAIDSHQTADVKPVHVSESTRSVLVEGSTPNFHPDRVDIVTSVDQLESSTIGNEVLSRCVHSLVVWALLAVKLLARLLVALQTIEISDDDCWFVILHFDRCQSLFISLQVSRFGLSNESNFVVDAFGILIFVCFTVWGANTFWEAFLHYASLANPTVCFVARFYFERSRKRCAKGRKLRGEAKIRRLWRNMREPSRNLCKSRKHHQPRHGLHDSLRIPAANMKISSSEISSLKPMPRAEQHSSSETSFATRAKHFPSSSIFA